jgi:hypothetical protein
MTAIPPESLNRDFNARSFTLVVEFNIAYDDIIHGRRKFT